MGEPITSDDTRLLWLNAFTELIGTTKRLDELLAGEWSDEIVAQMNTELSVLRSEVFIAAWTEVLTELLDPQRWRSLAGDSERFDAELAGVFERIRKVLRYQSGVPMRQAQRPIENSTRDEQIVALRTQGLTFGQIGLRLSIRANVAQVAYNRFLARDRQQVREFVEMMLDIHDVAVRLGLGTPLPPFPATT